MEYLFSEERWRFGWIRGWRETEENRRGTWRTRPPRGYILLLDIDINNWLIEGVRDSSCRDERGIWIAWNLSSSRYSCQYGWGSVQLSSQGIIFIFSAFINVIFRDALIPDCGFPMWMLEKMMMMKKSMKFNLPLPMDNIFICSYSSLYRTFSPSRVVQWYSFPISDSTSYKPVCPSQYHPL